MAQACCKQLWATAGGAHPCQHPEPTAGSHQPPPEVSRWRAAERGAQQVRPTELLPNAARAERLRDVCSNRPTDIHVGTCMPHSSWKLLKTLKIWLNYSLCRQFCRAFGSNYVDPTHLALVSPVCTKLLLTFQQ